MGKKLSVKITKEQYNRIFASGLITENTVINSPKVDDKEVIDLITYLYGKSDELSPFWADNDITYNDICGLLLDKKLIVGKDDGYEIPKSLGSPQRARQLIKDELLQLISDDAEENESEIEEDYPLGAEHDPMAPYNREDGEEDNSYEEEPIVELNGPLTTLGSNHDISILTDGVNLYAFLFGDKSETPLSDEEINSFAQINPEEIGYGLDSWDKGDKRLVQIDEPLKAELLDFYEQDNGITTSLSPIEEEISVEPIVIGGEEPTTNKVVQKLKQLKQEEEVVDLDEMAVCGSAASGGSSGPVTGALSLEGGETEVIKRSYPPVPVVKESTDSSSSGPYDANALPNISRNGDFKTPKKTNAQKKTQYPDGGFVDFNDCTKLNNKVSSTGCSQGAVDNVVKVKKTKDSVIAPSLSENKIIEIISQKTGKSVDEVKRIIESKKH